MNLRGREFPFEKPPPNLADLIAQRLTGRPTTSLPPPTRDEDPADIFVDLAAEDETWRRQLSDAAATLLAGWVEELTADDPVKVAALGELCYLVARIGCREALDPLRRLAESKGATALVAPGEDLRLRALRALVGLLWIADRDSQTRCRGVLMEALEDPRLALTSATGLLAVWPKEREMFLKMLPDSVERGDLLDVAIEIVRKSS